MEIPFNFSVTYGEFGKVVGAWMILTIGDIIVTYDYIKDITLPNHKWKLQLIAVPKSKFIIYTLFLMELCEEVAH